MSERVGRAQVPLVIGLVGAFALMALAVGVALLANPGPARVADATASVTPTLAGRPTASDAPIPTPTPRPFPAVARPLVLPVEIADREELPSCGHETVNRQPDGDYYDRGIWECFLAARESGQAAEVIRDSLTIEAGSIRELFRTIETGDIEWYLDTSQDRASGQRWMFTTCTSLRKSGEDPAGTPIYVPDGCGATEAIRGIQASASDVGIIEQLVAFARSPDGDGLDGLPLADHVWLGLADALIVQRTARELTDPAAWTLEVDHFRGGIGPFSALDLLATRSPSGQPPVSEASVTVGEHPHCASPPVDLPPEMAETRRVSIQPVRPAACPSWWTVDLFLAADGTIVAITLDRWEP